MRRLAIAGLVSAGLFLTACNEPAKTTSVTTDDTAYPSNTTGTGTYGTNTYTAPSTTTGTTYNPVYTTTPSSTTDTSSTAYNSGSTSTYTPPSNTYNTTTTSPPVVTTVQPSNTYASNTEMSDEPITPSGGKSKARSNSGGSGGGQSYTVKSGDNLSKIAKKFYGDSGKWNRIYKANKSKISDPNRLKPGTKLMIP
jgi:nucleoid-associated protein YgaU